MFGKNYNMGARSEAAFMNPDGKNFLNIGFKIIKR
jgi:hypothetical protein